MCALLELHLCAWWMQSSAGCVTCGGESTALTLKTWILPLAAERMRLYYLVFLYVGLGPDLLLGFYSMSAELGSRLRS